MFSYFFFFEFCIISVSYFHLILGSVTVFKSFFVLYLVSSLHYYECFILSFQSWQCSKFICSVFGFYFALLVSVSYFHLTSRVKLFINTHKFIFIVNLLQIETICHESLRNGCTPYVSNICPSLFGYMY